MREDQTINFDNHQLDIFVDERRSDINFDIHQLDMTSD
jgi:hypothetical protein